MKSDIPRPQWCFAWPAHRNAGPGQDRATLVINSVWPSGNDIPVSFLDGNLDLKDKVKEVACRWTAPGLANLSLTFQESNNALIRISFIHPGSWSVIGTTCRQVTDTSQPTMNFGWLTKSSSDEDIQRVVLHEFGHALGLVHEHQNPAGGIKWNKAAIYRDLSGPPNNWTKEIIDANMFQPYAANETNFTTTDFKSIMLYPIPPGWTTDGFTVGLNSSLSKIDKSFIHSQYQ